MPSLAPPILFAWDGEVMRPHPRAMRDCDRFFVVGEQYRLIERQDRSPVSHAHYFACVNEAWENLPEDLAARYPSAEHLRKWALIRAGYADSRQIVTASTADALHLSALVRSLDGFAVITVSGPVVTIWTAHSQSYGSMDRKTFQKSKDDVLAILSGLIGTDRDTLEENAGRAA